MVENKIKKISIKTIFAIIFYLIIPLFAIFIIIISYDELSKERFIRMIYWIVPTSCIIIMISQLSLKYEKGSLKKYLINISYVIMTLLWVYGFIGGQPVITEQWLEYEFSLHLWKYLSLIFIAALINIIYYTLEWRFYKEEFQNKKEENKSYYPNYEPEKTCL